MQENETQTPAEAIEALAERYAEYEKTIIGLQQEAHSIAFERGWWDTQEERDVFEMLQLVSTEVAEATEGERKDLVDDHLPHRKMGEVELADAAIRLMDCAGYFNWRFEFIEDIARFWDSQEHKVAKMHLMINSALVSIAAQGLNWTTEAQHARAATNPNCPIHYSAAITMLICTADKLGYNLFDAIREKMEYNKTRTDHSKEARAAKGGKAF